MNCDEAFDALTDVVGRESDDLQRHLNLCPRCRQMREVLEPALSLFDPAPEAENLADLAGDDAAESIRQKFLSVEAVQMARETAQRLSVSGKKQPPAGLKRHAAWMLLNVAAAAAAVAIVFTLFAPMASGPERRQSATGAASPAVFAQCLWKDRPSTARAKSDAKVVVSSCVACHFDKAID